MRDGITVTVVGWAASDPKEVVAGSGTPFTSFRLASTPRRYDARAGEWRDGRTEWFTVKAFRDAAFTIATSVRKGQPVVAVGRLATEEWVDGEGVTHTSLALEASAVGHDLTRGRAHFVRRVVRSAPVDGDPGEGAEGASGPEVPAEPDDVVDGDPWAVEAFTAGATDPEPATT